MTGSKTEQIQIKLKLDAEANSHLTLEQLKHLSYLERKKLRDSVSSYLVLIDSANN